MKKKISYKNWMIKLKKLLRMKRMLNQKTKRVSKKTKMRKWMKRKKKLNKKKIRMIIQFLRWWKRIKMQMNNKMMHQSKKSIPQKLLKQNLLKLSKSQRMLQLKIQSLKKWPKLRAQNMQQIWSIRHRNNLKLTQKIKMKLMKMKRIRILSKWMVNAATVMVNATWDWYYKETKLSQTTLSTDNLPWLQVARDLSTLADSETMALRSFRPSQAAWGQEAKIKTTPKGSTSIAYQTK